MTEASFIEDRPVAPRRPLGVTSLTLGCVSIPFGVLLVIPALGIVFGLLALRREPTSHGMGIAGVTLSLVGLVLGLLVGFVLLMVMAIVVNSGGNPAVG